MAVQFLSFFKPKKFKCQQCYGFVTQHRDVARIHIAKTGHSFKEIR